MKIRNVVSTLICFTVVSSIPFMVAAQETPGRDWEKERVIVAKLEEDTTEDNTHPSPKERFRLGQRIAGATSRFSGGVVWDLFNNPAELMAELTADVATRVTEGSGVDVTASHA